MNKARDARHHHVRLGNDNCDKCYYVAVENGEGAGHHSNIIKHFFSDEYIHSQFHKCPNKNCDFGYCMLQSLITHAEIVHNGSLRQSLQNQDTGGGMFYWIIPKTKEILAPVQLSSLIPIEKLMPKKISKPGNIGTMIKTEQKMSIKSRKLSNSQTSSITQTTSRSEGGIDSLSSIPKNNPIKDFDSRIVANAPSTSFILEPNSRSYNAGSMPITPFTTAAALAQNILAPVHLINMINSHIILRTSNLAGKIESIDNNAGESSQRRKRQRCRAKGTWPWAPGQRSLKYGQRHLAKASNTTCKELEEIKKQMKHFETLLKGFDDIKNMILANALHQESHHHHHGRQAELSTRGTQTENEDVEPGLSDKPHPGGK